MAKLSKETKQRLQTVFQAGQFVIRWGFIPTVLYLGFARGGDPGMPEPNILRYTSAVGLRTTLTRPITTSNRGHPYQDCGLVCDRGEQGGLWVFSLNVLEKNLVHLQTTTDLLQTCLL
ncbi:unnamed protein product [Coregonus sp. 'balchen']|nr:unnamed protein product [Coregonus sp. 'balchen']